MPASICSEYFQQCFELPPRHTSLPLEIGWFYKHQILTCVDIINGSFQTRYKLRVGKHLLIK